MKVRPKKFAFKKVARIAFSKATGVLRFLDDKNERVDLLNGEYKMNISGRGAALAIVEFLRLAFGRVFRIERDDRDVLLLIRLGSATDHRIKQMNGKE